MTWPAHGLAVDAVEVVVVVVVNTRVGAGAESHDIVARVVMSGIEVLQTSAISWSCSTR